MYALDILWKCLCIRYSLLETQIALCWPLSSLHRHASVLSSPPLSSPPRPPQLEFGASGKTRFQNNCKFYESNSCLNSPSIEMVQYNSAIWEFHFWNKNGCVIVDIISKQTECSLKTEHTHAPQNFGTYTMRKSVIHSKHKSQQMQLDRH